MKTLFAVWGFGALALAGTLHFAHTPEQQVAHGRSLAKAAAQVAAFETKQTPALPVIASPVTARSHITQVTVAELKVKKAKTQKVAQKKAKKNRTKTHKRKQKNPVLASFRKVDRFLKRAF